MRVFIVPALLVIACVFSAVAQAADVQPAPQGNEPPLPHAQPVKIDGPRNWTGNINGFIGGKQLDHDDWAPYQGQFAYGAQFDIAHREWPAALCVQAMGGARYKKEEKTDTETLITTDELMLGVRKIWGGDTASRIRFSLAGGVDFAVGRKLVKVAGVETSNYARGMGVWGSGGFWFELARHVNIGPQLTVSSVKGSFSGKSVNIGGIFAGGIVGYHF